MWKIDFRGHVSSRKAENIGGLALWMDPVHLDSCPSLVGPWSPLHRKKSPPECFSPFPRSSWFLSLTSNLTRCQSLFIWLSTCFILIHSSGSCAPVPAGIVRLWRAGPLIPSLKCLTKSLAEGHPIFSISHVHCALYIEDVD